MNWLYNEKEITNISQFPLNTFGFVYEVTTPEGKKYIGKKVLYHNQKRKLVDKSIQQPHKIYYQIMVGLVLVLVSLFLVPTLVRRYRQIMI